MQVPAIDIICSDLESIWIPEIWIEVARHTGIQALSKTTRDIKNYDELMTFRIKTLKQHKLKLSDIQQIANSIKPLPGAVKMISWIRSVCPFFIVSDTFIEIVGPLAKKLGSPPLLCHTLETDEQGCITNYHLRSKNFKRKVVQAFQDLNFRVTVIGDSYNDLHMLKIADQGILFNPPKDIQNSSPGLGQTFSYKELKATLESTASTIQ